MMFQLPVIKALAILKLCAAEVNKEFDLKSDIADAIKLAAQEVGYLNVFSLLSLNLNILCVDINFYSSQSIAKLNYNHVYNLFIFCVWKE